MESALWSLIGTVIGGVITWYVARRYYIAAASDLSAETDRIRNLLRIALQAMEDAKMVKLNRDAAGNPTGMIHGLASVATISVSSVAELHCPEHPQGTEDVSKQDGSLGRKKATDAEGDRKNAQPGATDNAGIAP